MLLALAGITKGPFRLSISDAVSVSVSNAKIIGTELLSMVPFTLTLATAAPHWKKEFAKEWHTYEHGTVTLKVT